MFRPSILAAVIACSAALLAPPAHAQPTSPPPPPPGPMGPPGPPPSQPGPYAAPYGGQSGPYAPAPARPAFERSGWFIGFGLGAGGVGEDNGSESWSGGQFNGYFGGLVSPRLALLVELSFGSYENTQYSTDYGPEQRELTTVTLGA